MSALTRIFFRTPYLAPSTSAIIGWWESRRPIYNMAVGAAGLCTLTTIAVADLLPPLHRTPQIPLAGILVYALLANIGYSLGPLLDTMIVRRWGAMYSAVGPALFRYGFVFAVGVTLLPIPVVLLGIIVRLLGLN